MRSTLLKGALVTAAASLALAMAFTGTALADPTYVPDGDDLVGVGSDTTQFLIDSSADAYTPTAAAPTVRLTSFDATPPAGALTPTCTAPVPANPIQIRPDVCISRPNGSSAGITALTNNATVDYARSSRQSAVGPTEDQFAFIPVARDGLSYAFDNTGSIVPTNLTRTQLIGIYNCSNTLGLEPKLPQTGSGTRSFFLESLGTPGSPLVPGTCVTNVQEHDPAAVDGDNNALVPFSVARWRVNPPTPSNPPSGRISIAATGVSGQTYYDSRVVFNVVRDTALNSAGVQAVFGPTGYLCTRFANSASARQGFDVVSGCGTAVADR